MASSNKPECSRTSSPLEGEDFSELTKKEILYWSRKLQVTPTALFSLTRDELHKQLGVILKQEMNTQKQKAQLRNEVSENHPKCRLRGGAGPSIRDILLEAARQIEEMYGDSGPCDNAGYGNSPYTCATTESGIYDTSASHAYDPSGSCAFPTDLTYTISDEEPTFESTFEDSFQIDPNLASTARGVCGPRKLPVNDTFTLPQAGAPNATFQMPSAECSFPANETYNASGYPANATYSVRESPIAPNARQCPANNSTRSYPAEYSYRIASTDLNESSRPHEEWSPQSMAFLDDSYGAAATNNSTKASKCPRTGTADTSRPRSQPNKATTPPPPTFRNYTDYIIKYSPTGTEETANSISVENYDKSSGKVTASSRTYSLPPSSLGPNTTFDISSAPTTFQHSTTRCPSPIRSCPAASGSPTRAAVKTPTRSLPNQAYKPRKISKHF